MSLSVSALFTPISEDDVLENFLATLETLKIPARSWRKGGAYRNILRAVAKTYSGLTVVMSTFAKSGFLDDAEGVGLTLLAHFVYGVDRPEATAASGKVLFTNNGGGVYTGSPYTAGKVRVLWTDGNKTYKTTEDLSLTSVGQTQLVSIEAVEVGSASSAGPGEIDGLVTNLLGVIVTNPESVVGADAMSDDDLRALCRAKLAALAPTGARGAYAYAVGIAKRLDGSPVNINRHRVISNPTTGVVTVIVASPSGAPLSSDVDAVTDSVEFVRPDSVTAVVEAASTVAYSQSLTVWARAQAGVDATEIHDAVEAALTTMVASYPIGGLRKPPSTQGYLFATNIEGTAKTAHPTIYAIDGVGSDLALDEDEVATLAVTVTVRIVTS